MENKVIKAAMLGLGTVGTGVYKVLKLQKEEMEAKIGARVELKKILVRNLQKAAQKVDDPSVLTNDVQEILDDPEIEIVIEVMGGIQPALSYMLEALNAGTKMSSLPKERSCWKRRRRTAEIFCMRPRWREESRSYVR